MSNDNDTAEIEPVNHSSSAPLLLRGVNRYLVLLGVYVLAVLSAGLAGVPLTYALVWVGMPVLLLGALYLHAVNRIAKERRTLPWQRNIQPDPEGNWVSRATFERICFVLNEERGIPQMEGVVNLVTRKSIWRFLRLGLPGGVVALWVLVEAAVHPTAHLTYHRYVGHRVTTRDGISMTKYRTVTEHHTVPTGVYLLIMAIVLLVVVLLAWMDWYYTYHLITNVNVRLVRVPPLWLPFLRRENKSVKLRNIDVHEPKDTGIGNMLGYGNVMGDTPTQNDEALRRMDWMPRHHQVDDILESAIETARRKNL